MMRACSIKNETGRLGILASFLKPRVVNYLQDVMSNVHFK